MLSRVRGDGACPKARFMLGLPRFGFLEGAAVVEADACGPLAASLSLITFVVGLGLGSLSLVRHQTLSRLELVA
jgi:hypothetical protein